MSGREERDMDAVHSTYAAGTPETLAAIVGGYRCGHCTGEVVELATEEATGILAARVEHDAGCPVLEGAVPVLPDLLRAAVPDTFRP